MSRKSFSSKLFTVLDHKLMKLDFKEDMKILLSCGASSMKKGLYEHFDYDVETVSLPGFIRSGAKIDEPAFMELMDRMNKAYPCDKKYKGYRLPAVDESDICIPGDKNDHENLNPGGKKTKRERCGPWLKDTKEIKRSSSPTGDMRHSTTLNM